MEKKGSMSLGPLTCHQQKGLGGPDVFLWRLKKTPHISKVYISWNKVSRPKALGDFRVLGATTHEPALGPYVNSLSTKDQHSSSETDEFIPSHG